MQKKDQGQYSAILTEAWLYYMTLKKTFTYRTNVGNPEQARRACSGSQSECRINFNLPGHGFSHIIFPCIPFMYVQSS